MLEKLPSCTTRPEDLNEGEERNGELTCPFVYRSPAAVAWTVTSRATEMGKTIAALRRTTAIARRGLAAPASAKNSIRAAAAQKPQSR